ncbi:RNA-binding cell elongation regulator Jag/EloR [Latilactobacillus sakei]|uniref:RNA-binding cell elongation regulator Jag/EloR n=1 Tax=Latilactobacillus sakei TaxID=1599 RepID=UPI000DC646FD|nr:RNA-binding cell elongation regulator Jag/EloR [Latilactobacillus sakei]SPS07372.1 R3H domain protein [Latilactobacillus sakei]
MPTFEGKDIQAAIDAGLAALKLTRDKVTVDVLEEGKKGFLGFGKQPAIVTLNPITVAEPTPVEPEQPSVEDVATEPADQPEKAPMRQSREATIEALKQYITDITAQIGTPVTMTVTKEHKQVVFHLKTTKEGLLIGKHGKTINALQYLAQTYYDHHTKGKQLMMLDVGDYRQRRATIVKHLADKAAREVVATGKAVTLEPMPAFERKIVHGYLTNNRHVQTHSEGRGDRRVIVVESARSF